MSAVAEMPLYTTGVTMTNLCRGFAALRLRASTLSNAHCGKSVTAQFVLRQKTNN